MIAASGKINNNGRPFFVFALYIKHSLSAAKKKEMIDLLVNAI